MREKQKTRKLKVYGQSGYKYQDTPTIVLKGKWLTDAGFNIGSDLMVECGAGKLVIKCINRCLENEDF